MTQGSFKDAKEHFSEVVTAAQRAPQMVTQDGKPAVVVVDAAEYERLTGGKEEPKVFKDGKEYTFVDHLLAIPKGGPNDLFERVPSKRREIDF